MKLTKWKLAAIAGGLALVAFSGAPAQAHTPPPNNEVTISDSVGNDFDPGCLVGIGDPLPPMCIIDANDPSSKATDIRTVKLEHDTDTFGGGACGTVLTAGRANITAAGCYETLKATMMLEGKLPADGSTDQLAFDGPNNTIFQGGSYRVMFHNKDKQTDSKNPSGGCTSLAGTTVLDQERHWADGHYQYLGYSINWTGTEWHGQFEYGTYNPAPDGGFVFYPLHQEPEMNGPGVGGGTDPDDPDGNLVKDLWSGSITTVGTGASAKSTIEVEMTGVLRLRDENDCNDGIMLKEIATHNVGSFPTTTPYAGDRMGGIFGNSTADIVVVLPVNLPLSASCDVTDPVDNEQIICIGDIQAIGGLVSSADETKKTDGSDVYYGGTGPLGQIDNLGDGPSCPTPTFGGTLPTNPLKAPNQPCQIDDPVLFSEFQNSGYGFIY